ncbi:MAG: hypothetical protein QNJ46_14870 [Leptolyngbyaceae cyanobacterium MO_188.B28]|nr:hypothetical protein [Leptolyngbyaceae cyanobacterium MO_188.B28]
MRQPTSSEASPQSPDLFILKPTLSSALSSLNVHLEEELARYRRQRQGRPVPPSQTSKTIKPSRKPLDLIAVKAETTPQKSAPAAPSNQTPRGAVTPPPPPPNPFLHKSGSSVPQNSKVAAAQSAESHSPIEAAGALAVMAKKVSPKTASPYALAPNPDKQGDPDDYLESSEELIKSIADRLKPKSKAAQPAQSQFGWSGRLATPTNVGSFLLLLVISAGLGYVGTNPEAVSHLFGRFWTDASAPDQPIESSADSIAGLSGKGGFRPLGPDLSSQEFVDLDLDALSTLPGTPNRLEPQPPVSANPLPNPGAPSTPQPQTVSNVPAAAQSVNPTPVAQPSVSSTPPTYSATPPSAVKPRPASAPISVAPSPTPSSNSSVASPEPNPVSSQTLPSLAAAPPVVAPSPQPVAEPPTTVAPAPIAVIPSAISANTESTPIATPRYRVVTPYTGDLSLVRVRGVVADAFVRESQIQAGAFADETAAQARVQELQNQGISAQVHVD